MEDMWSSDFNIFLFNLRLHQKYSISTSLWGLLDTLCYTISVTINNLIFNPTLHLRCSFVCLPGKNAAKDINLFLDSVFQKVRNLIDDFHD